MPASRSARFASARVPPWWRMRRLRTWPKTPGAPAWSDQKLSWRSLAEVHELKRLLEHARQAPPPRWHSSGDGVLHFAAKDLAELRASNRRLQAVSPVNLRLLFGGNLKRSALAQAELSVRSAPSGQAEPFRQKLRVQFESIGPCQVVTTVKLCRRKNVSLYGNCFRRWFVPSPAAS